MQRWSVVEVLDANPWDWTVQVGRLVALWNESVNDPAELYFVPSAHAVASRSKCWICSSSALSSASIFGQRPRRRVHVEVAGERDLVADLRLGVVHPGVGHVRQHLAGRRSRRRPRRAARSRCRGGPGPAAGCPCGRSDSSPSGSGTDTAAQTALDTGADIVTPCAFSAPMSGRRERLASGAVGVAERRRARRAAGAAASGASGADGLGDPQGRQDVVGDLEAQPQRALDGDALVAEVVVSEDLHLRVRRRRVGGDASASA